MSFSRQDISKKRKRYKSLPQKLTSKTAVWLVRLLLVVIVASVILGGYS